MMRVRSIVTLAGLLASSPALVLAQPPNLSGEWMFASGTTDTSRGNSKGERPTRTHTTSGVAFNCGRRCRIVHQGSTLTIDQAHLDGGDGTPSPVVTLQLDGRQETVVDSFNRGNKIETVSRWEDRKLLILSTAYGRPFTQTVSLDQDQLVVVTSSSTGVGWKTTLRYTKKQPQEDDSPPDLRSHRLMK